MNLSTAQILVTGGGSGIGLATAELLRQRGATVGIVGRREAVLKAAAERIGAIPFVADVRDEAQVAALIARAVATMDGYTALINNAGFGRFAPLLDTTADDMRAVWETNVLGAMLVARESAKHFVAEQYGHIINIASTAGLRGFPGGTAYTASKFALSAMTECWRAELRTSNVRVTQINPSEVITDFAAAAGRPEQADDPSKLHGIDIARAIVDVLEMDDRALVTDVTVWATNPTK